MLLAADNEVLGSAAIDSLEALLECPMPGLNQIRRTTLAFCGIKPLKTLTFGPLIDAAPARRQRWLEQASRLAAR